MFFSELRLSFRANFSIGYMIVLTEFCRNFVVRKAIDCILTPDIRELLSLFVIICNYE